MLVWTGEVATMGANRESNISAQNFCRDITKKADIYVLYNIMWEYVERISDQLDSTQRDEMVG